MDSTNNLSWRLAGPALGITLAAVLAAHSARADDGRNHDARPVYKADMVISQKKGFDETQSGIVYLVQKRSHVTGQGFKPTGFEVRIGDKRVNFEIVETSQDPCESTIYRASANNLELVVMDHLKRACKDDFNNGWQMSLVRGNAKVDTDVLWAEGLPEPVALGRPNDLRSAF